MVVVAYEVVLCVTVNAITHHHLRTYQVSMIHVQLPSISVPEQAPDLLTKDTQFVWKRKPYSCL